MTNHLHREWVTLAVFNNSNAARALQLFLSKSDFDARVYEERKLQRFWFWVKPHAGIQVQVPKDKWGGARNFLNIPPGTDPHLEKAIRCPLCDSLRVQYPQMTRKFFLPTLLFQIAFLFGLVERQNYCEDCHHTWRKSSRLRRSPSAKQKTTKAFAS